MVGLKFPYDLDAWEAWQQSRRPLHRAVARVRTMLRSEGRPSPASLTLYVTAVTPRVLVAIDATTPSNSAALARPLAHLVSAGVAVLASVPVTGILPPGEWEQLPWDQAWSGLADITSVLAAGHYLPAGRAAYRHSIRRDIPYGVVQHGLLTPVAPPLPFGSHVLSWSPEDADFWRSGRTDVTACAVGSQLLTEALLPDAADRVVERATDWADRSPFYLGQLHGAEMSKWGMARAAQSTCKGMGAIYRPHPSEHDLFSRAAHKIWERQGIQIQRDGSPLTDIQAPVIGVFSTGIVEAAARGIPAYADFPRPPRWLVDFWRRYRIGNVGGAPTAPPPALGLQPSTGVARWALAPSDPEGKRT